MTHSTYSAKLQDAGLTAWHCAHQEASQMYSASSNYELASWRFSSVFNAKFKELKAKIDAVEFSQPDTRWQQD